MGRSRVIPKLLSFIIGLGREISSVQEREMLRAIRESRTPVTAKEALEAYKRTLRGEDDEEE
jgi:hypothetical protein